MLVLEGAETINIRGDLPQQGIGYTIPEQSGQNFPK